jgi:hypothetical protein
MLTRFHKILLGLLAAQIVLAIVMLARGTTSAARKAEPVLAGFDAAKVTKLVVFASGDAKPAVELAKKNGAWVIASAFDYPADDAKVTDVLTPIAKMAAAAPIATQASRFKQLKVDDSDFEKKLVLTVGGKDTTLLVGTPAGARRTAVRLGGDSRVFAVAGPSAYAVGDRPRDWVDLKYVGVARDELAKLTIERGGDKVEKIVLTRDGEAWKPTIDGAAVALGSGESLDTSVVDRAVGDVTTLDLTAPGDPKRDASHLLATLTIERKAPAPAAPADDDALGLGAALGSGSGSGSGHGSGSGSGSSSGTGTGTGSRTGSGSAAAPAPAPIVLDIVADGDSYWVHDRAKPSAILVDKSRLETLVTLNHDKLVKKVEAPATPGKGSTAPAKAGVVPAKAGAAPANAGAVTAQ